MDNLRRNTIVALTLGGMYLVLLVILNNNLLGFDGIAYSTIINFSLNSLEADIDMFFQVSIFAYLGFIVFLSMLTHRDYTINFTLPRVKYMVFVLISFVLLSINVPLFLSHWGVIFYLILRNLFFIIGPLGLLTSDNRIAYRICLMLLALMVMIYIGTSWPAGTDGPGEINQNFIPAVRFAEPKSVTN